MAPEYRELPFGSAEMKNCAAGDRAWAVRSTLMRFKRPEKVHYNSYEPALKDHGEAAHISSKKPPVSPFNCASNGPYDLAGECSVCFPQYFPASLSVTDKQAETLAQSTVNSIESDLAFLRDTLARHADILVSRRKKKSREKRSAFFEDRPFTMDPSFNFAIIDYICRNDAKEAARISQTMLDRLSDMSILSEVIFSIRQDMTRNRSVDAQVAKGFAKHTTSPQDWIKKINAEHGKALGDSLGPQWQQLCQEFPWPRGKKDEKWLEEATAARACLTELWTQFRALWTQKLKEAKVSQRLINEDIQLLSLASTMRYREALEQEKQDILTELVAQRSKTIRNRPVELQVAWGRDHEVQAEIPPRPRAKIAHSPELGPPSDKAVTTPQVGVASNPNIISPHLIFVKYENLTVLHHMFPVKGAESQRSFSWQEFLSAMVDVGFTILQSQGSAVTLRLNSHTDRGVNTIVLHRPHPRPIVNPVMLRRIAKRMQKWFGWHRETFEEKPK